MCANSANLAHVVRFGGHRTLVVGAVRADVRVRSARVSRIGCSSTIPSSASVGVPAEIVILFVEYGGFGHSSLASSFSDLLIKLFGSAASDTRCDEYDEQGDTNEADDAEHASYGACV